MLSTMSSSSSSSASISSRAFSLKADVAKQHELLDLRQYTVHLTPPHRRFFFLFRSFGSCQPLFFVLIIGPPGIPKLDKPPPIRDFISLSFPIIPIPPT